MKIRHKKQMSIKSALKTELYMVPEHKHTTRKQKDIFALAVFLYLFIYTLHYCGVMLFLTTVGIVPKKRLSTTETESCHVRMLKGVSHTLLKFTFYLRERKSYL